MIFYDALYKNIFNKYAEDFRELNIITGYASGTFLKKVSNEFSHLNINLYIGMYKEGISKENHNLYKELSRETSINVYYQISGNPTHMKIYHFKKEESCLSLIGSSNFSENGFEYNKEIITIVEELDESIFINQQKISLHCTSSNIEEFINIYEDKDVVETSFVNEQPILYKTKNSPSSHSMSKTISLLLNKLYTRRNLDFYNKFSFSAVLRRESDISWSRTGINHSEPFIKQNNMVKFADVFPTDKEFKIYAPDIVFECKLGGRFYSNLYFTNINIYDYFAEKLSLTEKEKIDSETLDAHGINRWIVERINEEEYILVFEK